MPIIVVVIVYIYIILYLYIVIPSLASLIFVLEGCVKNMPIMSLIGGATTRRIHNGAIHGLGWWGINWREEMKIDINKQYKTSEGQPVKIYTTEHDGRFPVVGSVGGRIYEWTDKGHSPYSLDLSLIEVKPEQVVWVVIEEGGNQYYFDTEEEARSLMMDKDTLYRVPITDDMVVE